jgi:uncharacterized protein YndB with AHSA1/START domain
MKDADTSVTTSLTEDTASASTTVAAPPSDVFEYLRNPANHAAISGDATVIRDVRGPALLEPESRFTMKMRRGPVRYRITSTVVEYDLDTGIAWAHLGGHRWRWELRPAEDGGTIVTETYDQSTARLRALNRLMGYPKGHLDNVARSVANVAQRFAS